MTTGVRPLFPVLLTFFTFNVLSTQAADVVFFVNNADALNAGDDGLALLLEDMGHSVFAAGHDELPVDQLDLANDNDLVIISESVTSGNIGANLNETQTPIIVYEPFVFDDMDLTGPTSTTSDFDGFDFGFTTATEFDLNIINPDHPMAAGLEMGDIAVYESPAIVSWGVPTDAADLIARPIDGEESAAIFVYEEGDELFGGDTAVGTRIGFFLHNRTSEPTLLSDEGVALLAAAVNFALGVQDTPGDFNGNKILDVMDVNTLMEGLRGVQEPQFDLNDDGKADTADLTFWVKTLKKTWFGDANLDGEFNSSDLVQVFTANGTGGPADWGEGDWNGDRFFDSGDLVVAFTDGGYERGTLPALAAVPEPVCTTSTAIGFAVCMIATLHRRRRVL